MIRLDASRNHQDAFLHENMMNRNVEDTPYVFRPPKYSRFWASILYRVSDALYLRHKHKVVGVKIASGGDEILRLHRDGNSILITPNHSDHCDPHSLLHFSRRTGMPMYFMAAREVFEKKKGIHGAVLQRAGVFSIDRENPDLSAIKEAMRILHEAKHPLVMFPEGEIYHLNEQLTPLNEGAATLALRTTKKLRKDGLQKSVFVVPTAMRYGYIDDISHTFPKVLERLESHIFWAPQTDLDVVSRIYKFGEAVLSLKEKEHLNRTLEGPLDKRIAEFREILLREEEMRYFSKICEGNHPARVRHLRGKIRSILLDGEKPSPDTARQCHRSLDTIYFATQLYSYPGQYLRRKPSMDRIAETLLKFEEDILGHARIAGKRSVEITFCRPLNMSDYLEEYDNDSKSAVAKVTTVIENEIKGILEGRGEQSAQPSS